MEEAKALKQSQGADGGAEGAQGPPNIWIDGNYVPLYVSQG